MKRSCGSVFLKCLGAAALCLAAGCGDKLPIASGKKAPSFRSAPIVRMDIVRTVSATGSVTPRNSSSGIPVGAQVNGKLIKLYVDYNDTVTNGQVVAEIDPLVYEANYKSAVARLHVSQAGVLTSECALKQREAELVLAQKTFDRKKTLSEKKMAPVADFDSAVEALDKAKAAVESAKAA
ncbi:MAG: biotin/lipoyl-binding protein, partial [Kiritimatiellae bacterium]|nr:biotin/lipoyl-binding protein [Kiritimatiellia bacterium]